MQKRSHNKILQIACISEFSNNFISSLHMHYCNNKNNNNKPFLFQRVLKSKRINPDILLHIFRLQIRLWGCVRSWPGSSDPCLRGQSLQIPVRIASEIRQMKFIQVLWSFSEQTSSSFYMSSNRENALTLCFSWYFELIWNFEASPGYFENAQNMVPHAAQMAVATHFATQVERNRFRSCLESQSRALYVQQSR